MMLMNRTLKGLFHAPLVSTALFVLWLLYVLIIAGKTFGLFMLAMLIAAPFIGCILTLLFIYPTAALLNKVGRSGLPVYIISVFFNSVFVHWLVFSFILSPLYLSGCFHVLHSNDPLVFNGFWASIPASFHLFYIQPIIIGGIFVVVLSLTVSFWWIAVRPLKDASESTTQSNAAGTGSATPK